VENKILKKFTILLVMALFLLPFLCACQSDNNVIVTSDPVIPTTHTNTSVPSITTILSKPEIPALATLVPTIEWHPSDQTNEAPDNIVIVPGGAAYASSVHQAGVPDKWPAISLTFMLLDNGSDTLRVNYRSYIETKKGETRNNIINASTGDLSTDKTPFNHKLTLYSLSVAEGITLGVFGGGGIPGTSKAVLTIKISTDIDPGEYVLKIGIVFDDVYYGTVPCTVIVTA